MLKRNADASSNQGKSNLNVIEFLIILGFFLIVNNVYAKQMQIYWQFAPSPSNVLSMNMTNAVLNAEVVPNTLSYLEYKQRVGTTIVTKKDVIVGTSLRVPGNNTEGFGGEVYVYRVDGKTGSLKWKTNISSLSQGVSQLKVIPDINKDSVSDIVIVDEDMNINKGVINILDGKLGYLLEEKGFISRTPLNTEYPNVPVSIEADLTGDGKADIITVNGNRVVVYVPSGQ